MRARSAVRAAFLCASRRNRDGERAVESVRIAEVRGSAAGSPRRNVVAMQPFGFRYFANRSPSALAVVDAAGREWARDELLDLADRIASALLGARLERGDVVAIVAPNCIEFLAVHLAALEAGLYVVPVNWHL